MRVGIRSTTVTPLGFAPRSGCAICWPERLPASLSGRSCGHKMNNPALANVPASPHASVLHQMGGGDGNRKFLSADGRHESVRDEKGNEATGENAATYNYGSNAVSHLFLDVLPWIAFGTQSPGDNTTMPIRVKKLVTAVMVKPCVQDQVCEP